MSEHDPGELVLVEPHKSMPFARAVVTELKLRDGKDHSHKLRWKGFSVVRAISDAARDRLQREIEEKKAG